MTRKLAILHIELDQRFRVLRDKRDRCYDYGSSFAPGATNFLIGRGANPAQRPDPALVAHPPIEPWSVQHVDDCHSGFLDMARVRITGGDDAFGQSMRSEQKPRIC